MNLIACVCDCAFNSGEADRSAGSPTVEALMSGIHYIRVSDHLQLLAICERLDQFCEQHPKVSEPHQPINLRVSFHRSNPTCVGGGMFVEMSNTVVRECLWWTRPECL